jgi:cysteine desulfurase family protein (TIGR01976 family)
MRERFPGIDPEWARFDGPAGTQMVDSAINAMADFLRSGANANGHGHFAASAASTGVVADARHCVGQLLGADPDGIVFGANMTTLNFALTRALARDWSAGDEIVGTRLDHDANVTPWRLAAEDRGAVVRLAEFDTAAGRLDPDAVGALLGSRTRWVAVTGASNALGTMPDLPAIVAAAHAAGARVLVDGVHLVPHDSVDIRALGCDAFLTSPYKWYGPHAGVLWLAPDLRDSLPAYKVRPAPDTGPERWETGTPSFEAIAAIRAAAAFLLDTGLDTIRGHETTLLRSLLNGLLEMDHVTVHGPHGLAARTPTVCFSVTDRHPDDVAAELAADRIAVWSGNYYAVETMGALGLTDGAVRAGISCYTSEADVARLLAAVRELAP